MDHYELVDHFDGDWDGDLSDEETKRQLICNFAKWHCRNHKPDPIEWGDGVSEQQRRAYLGLEHRFWYVPPAG